MPRLAFLAVLLSACVTHLPPGQRVAYRGVHWARDFDSAQAHARDEGKPIPLVLVAGELDGPC
jgi:hypothetical protein